MVVVWHNYIGVEFYCAALALRNIEVYEELGKSGISEQLSASLQATTEIIGMAREVYPRQTAMQHKIYFSGQEASSCPTK